MSLTRWDETWHRLLNWTNGPARAERLAAQILLADGFTALDPSHPLGGKDGGVDALVTRGGHTWAMAAYFPRAQQSFTTIQAKVTTDARGAAALDDVIGMAFVTNQELRLGERRALREGLAKPLEIYHLERLVAILDQPKMYGVRKQFLDIEPSATEIHSQEPRGELSAGTRLEGEAQGWTVEGPLGAGGTATVTGVIGDDGRLGAVKVLSDHRFVLDLTLIERYERELDALRAITSQHVLAVLDVVNLGQTSAGIFERAEESLHERLATKPAGTVDALLWLQEAACGLAAIHEAGLVHRDVSPKNLLLMSDGRLCVSDLGAARALKDETVTRSGDHLGSLLWVSPQQAAYPHGATPADDVFSLGQIGYLLLTGERPHGNPPPLGVVRSDLPHDLVRAIERMRQHDRNQRPRDAGSAAASIHLSGAMWLQIASGLVERREFSESADLVCRAVRFDGKPPDLSQAIDAIFGELSNQPDPTIELRFARWAAKVAPSEGSVHRLVRAERAWRKELHDGRDPALKLVMPSDAAALTTEIRAHFEIFRDLLEAMHRTSLWMKLPPEGDEVLVPRGLSNLGDERVREALIVCESLLAFTWSAESRESAQQLLPLLPTRWCQPFDELDEALLARAARDALDEGPAFRRRLTVHRDGRGLGRRYEDWMQSSCRCQLVGVAYDEARGVEVPRPRESVECPFVRLRTAAATAFDAEAWATTWIAHPQLWHIPYAAEAATHGFNLAQALGSDHDPHT